MTGPGTDAWLFEFDDEENLDSMADEAEQDDGAYGADDDFPPRICGNLYDGQ